MKIKEVLRWGFTLAVFATLVAFDTGVPIAAVASIVPFLLASWLIRTYDNDRSEFYRVARIVLVLLLLPVFVIAAVGGGGLFLFLVLLPFMAAGIWGVVKLTRLKAMYDPLAKVDEFERNRLRQIDADRAFKKRKT